MAEYEYWIQHVEGIRNVDADYFSPHPGQASEEEIEVGPSTGFYFPKRFSNQEDIVDAVAIVTDEEDIEWLLQK